MKKKIVLLGMIVLTFLTIPVMAKTDNGFHVDEDVSIKKNLNTTNFSIGNNVEMTSEIDGMNFVAGNNISLTSKQDHLFAAGNNIYLEEAETKDAFLAGSSIHVKSSTIRDLYAAAEKIRIDSDISRNAYLAGDEITINGNIAGDVLIAAESIRIGKNAIISGTLKYPEKSNISISESAQIEKTKTYKSNDKSVVTINIVNSIIDSIYAYCSMLLITILLLAFCKKFFKKLDKTEKKDTNILITCLLGFGFLVITPIASIVLMLTMIGMPLSFIVLAIYCILIYLSMIPTAYILGKMIFQDKITSPYLLMVISLAIIYIARIIPFIGGIIGFLSLIFGLGIYIEILKEQIQSKK